MEYTLSYRSSRREIWRWYWRKWRSHFWRVHLFVAGVTALVCSLTLDEPLSIASYAVSFLVVFPLIVVLLAAWPQIKFKPQERTLRVGPEGWSTAIGKASSSRAWSEIALVYLSDDAVEIQNTDGNAMIVPLRAFAGREQMEQFSQDAHVWHSGPAA